MNEMTCESGVKLLMEYLEGTLAGDARAAVEAHVAVCPRCVAFLASYRETPRLVRELTVADIPVDLAASLRAHLRAHRRKPLRER
jgi:anti-sigma factor RsiW